MKRVFIAMVSGLMALAASASVTVTESPTGTVTIAVDGEAGQIGQEIDNWGNKTYDYASTISTDDQSLIKNAQNVIITGNINAIDVKTLVAKNADNGNWTLNHLDMGGATIDKIEVEGSEWYASAHTFLPTSNTRIACKKMTLPMTNDHAVPAYFRACFGPSNNISLEEIVLPEGYDVINQSAFKNLPNLSSVVLPNTLTTIKDNAFEECAKLKVMVFPESLTTLGDKVFNNTKLMDVYFLGKEAPTVGNNAFDDGTYKGNGGMVMTGYGNTDEGYAERMNYVNEANTFGLLHLRTDLTNEQRAKYIDITREYKVEKGADNKYKAFYDLYYGENKIWPGQYSYDKTYNDAVNGTLWDGVTTYDKDKYMGLHKFTLTVSNVYNTDTKKWTFPKLSADQWWTICVPFNMTKAQVSEVFGENTEVCKFSKVTRNQDEYSILLEFKDDQMASATNDDDMVIEANIAYMIFPTKQLASGTNYVFDGYTMETGSPEPTSVKPTFIPESSGYDECTYRFIGTYLSRWDANENDGVGQPILMSQYSYFLGAKAGKHQFFYQIGTTGKWNPFTATVQVFKGQSNTGIDDSFIVTSGAKMMSIFGGQTATGVEKVAFEIGTGKNAATVVYNINGQVVRRGTSDLEGLPSGVYIVNGKKYVINH